MVDTFPKTVTQLLEEWSGGDQDALRALLPLVHGELHRVARSYMRRERPGHTLQTTGLINEAYLRLVAQKTHWKSRAHFYGIAAQMMRRVLVDHAKSHQTAKRGAGAHHVQMEMAMLVSKQPDADLVALDEALSRLEQIDPRRGRIVELRFFGGLSNEEASEVLGISTATIQRQWTGARAWLYRELRGQDDRLTEIVATQNDR
jgi:RNA polymerase sigma factor (TIGR02999 family)